MSDALRQARVETAAQRQIYITDWRQRNQTFFSALRSSATSCS
jgi:lipoprotein-releasing system permease protein